MSKYHFDYEDYLNVVETFTSTHDNLSSKIAKRLDLKTSYVDYLLDIHLSLKKNYMGSKIEPIQSNLRGNNEKPVRVSENGEVIGYFRSRKESCDKLGVTFNYRYDFTNKFTIKHRKGVKTYRTLTYELL